MNGSLLHPEFLDGLGSVDKVKLFQVYFRCVFLYY